MNRLIIVLVTSILIFVFDYSNAFTQSDVKITGLVYEDINCSGQHQTLSNRLVFLYDENKHLIRITQSSLFGAYSFDVKRNTIYHIGFVTEDNSPEEIIFRIDTEERQNIILNLNVTPCKQYFPLITPGMPSINI